MYVCTYVRNNNDYIQYLHIVSVQVVNVCMLGAIVNIRMVYSMVYIYMVYIYTWYIYTWYIHTWYIYTYIKKLQQFVKFVHHFLTKL